jgi:exopolysaccharide biosynthesis polyprenyl glycosylphosphotransferase
MAAPDFVGPSFYPETIASPRTKPRTISGRLFRSALSHAEAAADFLICAAGISAAFYLFAHLPIAVPIQISPRLIAAVSGIFGFFVVFLQYRDAAYRGGGGLLQIRETERAIRVPAQAAILLWIVSLLLGLRVPVLVFLAAIVMVPALLILQKQIVFAVVRRLQQSGDQVDRVVVYGAGDTGRGVLSALLHSPRLGFQPVAMIDDGPALAGASVLALGYRGRPAIPVKSGPLTSALLESLRCDLLMLAIPDLSSREVAEFTQAAEQAGSEIAILVSSTGQEQRRTESVRTESFQVDGLQFASSKTCSNSWLYAMAKRLTDLVLSSVLLVLLAPLFIFIAILVRLDSPGPALFVQKRVGLNGDLFNMFKFRSMFEDAAKYAPSPTSSSDPRITRIGRFLRRASLDELPQLINVFLGAMSLVGPRPEMPFIVEDYDSRQCGRLQVVPGITGLWQLSADRAFPIHFNVEYDLYYIRNRTFAMDVAILIHTLIFTICGGI